MTGLVLREHWCVDYVQELPLQVVTPCLIVLSRAMFACCLMRHGPVALDALINIKRWSPMQLLGDTAYWTGHVCRDVSSSFNLVSFLRCFVPNEC